jgi:phosphatidylserine/phosphatidylglycerophosphate/cardiolipin synthase-like enzyme
MRFLTTKQIAGEIERVIREARVSILLISPYLRIDAMYFGRLREAPKRGVNCRVVFRKGKEDSHGVTSLAELPDISLFSLERLHAKCYLNESTAILTSMNLYESSEHNNREMGLVLERREHAAVYEEILSECESIVGAASRYSTTRSWSQQGRPEDVGYCIRCKQSLDLDTSRPLCSHCYNEWARYQNEDYTERFCHGCGRPEPTSMARPLCISCYRTSTTRGFELP